MGTYAFDEDTSLSPSGETTLTGRWNGTAGLVNGGYMMSICLKALARLFSPGGTFPPDPPAP